MNTVRAVIPLRKPGNKNISILWKDDQKDLIKVLAESISEHKPLEVIGCLAASFELHKSNTPNSLQNYIKDQEFTVLVLDAVTKFAENLTEDAKTTQGCRQVRRRARDQLLIAIGDIKVI